MQVIRLLPIRDWHSQESRAAPVSVPSQKEAACVSCGIDIQGEREGFEGKGGQDELRGMNGILWRG
jgi:hypothetical protein